MFRGYILYSLSSDRYYVGHTDNVDRCIAEHNFSEHMTYTSKHRPWILKRVIEIDAETGWSPDMSGSFEILSEMKGFFYFHLAVLRILKSMPE
jgi:putative endonuclease